MRRYKNWAHKIVSWKYLTIWRFVLLFFPREHIPDLHPELLSGCAEISSTAVCGLIPAEEDCFGTLWTVACQAPLSMGFPRQEYWDGLPFPSLEDLPNPRIKPTSPAVVEADGKGQFLVGTMIQKYNFSVYFQRKWNWVLKKYLHAHVPCSITYNSQDIEST